MAARYWRVIALDTYGREALAVSALHLYAAGARVDAAATVSCTIAPASGSVTDLQSTALTATVEWPRAAYGSGGFAIVWDFGSAVDVDALRIGALDKARFPAFITLQSSDDGAAWAIYSAAAGVTYPGAGTLSGLPSGTPLDANDAFWLDFEGANGSTTMTDAAGHAFTAYGGAQLTTSSPIDGASSLLLNGSSSYLQAAASSDFNLGTGPFTLRLKIRPASFADTTIVCRMSTLSGVLREWAFQLSSATAFNFYYGIRGINNGQTVFTVPFTMSVGAVYDVVMGRDTLGRRRCFVNGAQCAVSYLSAATEYDTTDLDNPGNNIPLSIGTAFGFGYHYNGRLDALRLRKGEVPPADAAALRRIAATDATAPLRVAAYRSLVAAAADADSGGATLVSRLTTARDMEFGGRGRIWGTNEIEITPGNRVPTGGRVVLLRQRDRLLARETWANPVTGAWEFTDLDVNQGFLALAEDLAGNYRPVAANRLTPEAV